MVANRRVRAFVVAAITVALMAGLSGCQLARVGAKCRTTDWGDDGGQWVLQCRKGRWTRAITKGQAAKVILGARANATPPPITLPPAPPPPARPAATAVGSIDSVSLVPGDPLTGRIRVQGWVTFRFEQASASDLVPTLTVNGDRVAIAPASNPAQPQRNVVLDVPRPDVAVATGWSTNLVGFDGEVESTRPQNHICLTGVVSGEWRDLSCVDIATPTTSSIGVPKAHIDWLEGGAGEITVDGWVLATQSPDSLYARVDVTELPFRIVNGVPAGGMADFRVLADQPLSYVAAIYPWAGPNHGFGLRITGVPPARYRVCVMAESSDRFGLNRMLQYIAQQCDEVTVT